MHSWQYLDQGGAGWTDISILLLEAWRRNCFFFFSTSSNIRCPLNKFFNLFRVTHETYRSGILTVLIWIYSVYDKISEICAFRHLETYVTFTGVWEREWYFGRNNDGMYAGHPEFDSWQGQDFCFLHVVERDRGAHPVSCLTGTDGGISSAEGGRDVKLSTRLHQMPR
jgi:hypothetical protein